MATLELTRSTETALLTSAAATAILAGNTPQEVLAFRLGDEEYGISLRCVQEIRSYQAPTRLAGAGENLLGVIDLRGEVVPLLDLRRRFGLPRADFDAMTVIIVISLAGRCVGVVADQVNDVVMLPSGQIRSMPGLPGCSDHTYMVAIGVVEERRLVLLDIERLLADSVLPQGDAQAALPH